MRRATLATALAVAVLASGFAPACIADEDEWEREKREAAKAALRREKIGARKKLEKPQPAPKVFPNTMTRQQRRAAERAQRKGAL